MSVARLFVVNALVRIAAAASGQLFAFLLAERLSARVGVGAGLVGLLGACYFVTELFGAPFAGRVADVRGQRRVLGYGPIFGAACGFIGALAALGSLGVGLLVAVLVVARTAEGLSAACTVPTTLTLLSRATDGDAVRRTRVMGAFEITSLLAMIAGYAIAGVAWDARGAQAFLVLPAIYGFAWLLVGRVREAEPAAVAADHSVFRLVRELARERGNVAFGIAWLAVNAVVGVWMQQAPYLFKLPNRSPTQALVGGFTGSQVGQIFGAWGVAFLVGMSLWSLVGARVGRRRTLGVALVAMLGVVATLGLVNHGAGQWALGLATAFVLIESGFTPAALAHLADVTGAHDASRGAAMGLYSLLLGTGQLAGNVVGAPFAARWQMDGVLLVTALLAAIALAGVARMASGSRSAPQPHG